MEKGEIKQKFFELNTRKDVAELLGISDQSLRYFLFKVRPENMYRTFEIPKGNGAYRMISAPERKWKMVQRKLARVLAVIYEPKHCAYGFIEKKNCVLNAKNHINKKILLNVDLKDFFSQIHFGRIRGMLMAKPYSIGEEAATTIAQIACLNGRLPQGAPSSPVIANMVAAPLDNALMRLAERYQCIYTRYADDITFSTSKAKFDDKLVSYKEGEVRLGKELEAILRKNSFEANYNKVALRPRTLRQEVTGLTVNVFPNLRRSYVRQLRGILHSCEKYGVYAAAKGYVEKGYCNNSTICSLINNPAAEERIVAWFKHVIIGKVNYVKQVKGDKDLTFLSFAKKVNEVLDEKIFDVTALGFIESAIKNSIFILESENGQGSAFYLSGVGLITSYHVIKNDDYFDVYTEETYEVERLGRVSKSLNCLAYDENIDYALFRSGIEARDELSFKQGDSKSIKIGDKVTIVGFPNYSKGNTVYKEVCNVTSKRTYFGADFFTVSGRIGHGASGGVVLNSANEAIGIIKGGIASMDEESSNEYQGFVPLHLAIEHYKRNYCTEGMNTNPS